MIAELIHENKPYRFRIAWLSTKSTIDYKYDVELTCISEEFPEKLTSKIFKHLEWKRYVKDGIIKVIT